MPSDPWFYVALSIFLIMPVRFLFASLLYGPREALKHIGGYWLGFVLFAGGGGAIMIAVIRLLPKVLPDVPGAGMIMYATMCAAFIGYLWLVGFLLSLIDRLKHALWPGKAPTEDQIREVVEALKHHR